jgi:hypothetical protein
MILDDATEAGDGRDHGDATAEAYEYWNCLVHQLGEPFRRSPRFIARFL